MMHPDQDLIRRVSLGRGTAQETAQVLPHLRECASCAALAAPPVEPPQHGAATVKEAGGAPPERRPSSSPAPQLGRGTSVGRYLILEPIGEGGMGVVHAAYDPELDRKVAIKLMRSTQDDDGVVGQLRLLREAQAMARISHPNVVAVHDVGSYEDQVFMAMELVAGTTLRHWLKQAQRPWRQVQGMMLAAGRGLAAAHAVGLAHRDFKPENVLVGDNGEVKVTDFGLARLASGGDTAAEDAERERAGVPPTRLSSTLTQAGILIGTPLYMAPEQYRGWAPDARSDQFSFCATLYYALFRQRPFEPRRMYEVLRSNPDIDGSSPSDSLAWTAGETAKLAVIKPPPREPRIPGWMRRAVMRGLSLAPQERFASMELLLEALSGPPRAFRQARAAAVGLAVVGLLGLAYQAFGRHQLAVCGGAEEELASVWDTGVQTRAEAAFSASGKPFAASTWTAARAVLDDYSRRWVAMRTEACQATRIRRQQPESVFAARMGCLDRRLRNLEALTRLLADADARTVERAVDAVNALPSLASCADTAALSTRAPPPEAPAAHAEYERISRQLAEARALHSAGKLKPSRALAESALAAAKTLGYPPLLAEAHERLGTVTGGLGEPREAAVQIHQAFLLAEASGDDELRATTASSLGFVVAYMQGHFEEGLGWLEQSQAILDRLHGNDALQVDLLLNLSAIYGGAGKYAEQRETCERGLALVAKALGPDHPRRARFLINLGSANMSLGNYARAQQVLEEGLALVERVRGPDHPESAALLDNLSGTLSSQGKHAEALPYARKALALEEAQLGAVNPRVASTHNTIASILYKQGLFAESLARNRISLELYEKTLGPESAEVAYPTGGIGLALLALGKPAEAVGSLERAIALKNPDPELMSDVDFGLARALEALGREPERARRLAAEARAHYLENNKPTEAARVEAWVAKLKR